MIAYGIVITEFDADFEKIYAGLGDLLLEEETDKDSDQVYVEIDHLREAVEIINGLGYSTDEDNFWEEDEEEL